MSVEPARVTLRWAVVATMFVIATIYGLRTNLIPTVAYFGGDCWEYQSMAVNFAHGHGLKVGAILPYDAYRFAEVEDAYLSTYESFIEGGTRGGDDNFYRTPAYPVLLGFLYALVGVRPDIVALIQMLVMISIGSLLPILGERLLGPKGFAAGIPAGILVSFFIAPETFGIMTEPLIAVACFLVLVAWVVFARHNDWSSGILVGFALAFTLLVKGSLIFIPFSLLAYVLIRGVVDRAFSRATVTAIFLAFITPLAAYSTWASQKAAKPILLTTQGRAALLDSHNDGAVSSGLWSPEWRDDPSSFYSKALRVTPHRSTVSLVAAFYLDDPMAVPRGFMSKLTAIGKADALTDRLAIDASLALLFLLLALKASVDVSQPTRYISVLGAMALIVVSIADPAVSAPGAALAGLAGLSRRSFREWLRTVWSTPLLVATIVVAINFLLLTLAIFAELRYVRPASFVLLLATFAMAITVLAEIEILPGLPLLPSKGGQRSGLGLVYARVRRSTYRLVADEMNAVIRYADSVLFNGTSDDTLLYDMLASRDKSLLPSSDLSSAAEPDNSRTRVIVLNGTFNSSLDIQALLSGIGPHMARRDRLLVVMYNPYLSWFYALLDRTGLRKGPPSTTFVTRRDLDSLARLSGFELVRLRPAANFPLHLLGIGPWIDGLLKGLPLVRQGAFASVAMLRVIAPETRPPSFSVVIPARNEAGNIRAAIERLPLIPGAETEVIFVEGGSTDDTSAEIERVVRDYTGPLKLRSFTQQGKGKGDAVRLGFSHATGDLLTILDADLTMPPEMLPRFYEAYRQGLGDFVNGSRLVYPMEGEAMRFLNTLGNIFFSKALAWILEAPLNDTLCGTKAISRLDYERVKRWREDFGDFDPFGDFELLFSAASMALGIVEIPVHYRARTYGTTNIHRFRHGLMLAKMSALGLLRIRMGIRSRARSEAR